MPRIAEVAVPVASKRRQAVRTVHFYDDREASRRRARLSVGETYRAMFAHAPGWARAPMTVRGGIVAPFGSIQPTRDIVNRAAVSSVSDSGFQVGRRRVGIFTVGRCYLKPIKPFHRVVGRAMVQDTADAGRL